jgi:hypothetical protein
MAEVEQLGVKDFRHDLERLGESRARTIEIVIAIGHVNLPVADSR